MGGFSHGPKGEGVTTKDPLTGSSPDTVSVGTSSVELVAANASRKGLIIVNLSSNTVCLAFGEAAVLNNGICLTENGSFNMDEYSFSTEQIRAIASGASSTVSIQEFT